MTSDCEWPHAPEACAEDFGRFEKSQWVEFLAQKKKVDFRELAEALYRVRTWFGADGKVSCIEKPLNSKLIKSFVPQLRSRKCCFFCVSGFLCYLCALWTLWTFCVPVWICLFHVFISGYVTDGFILFVIRRSVLSPWSGWFVNFQTLNYHELKIKISLIYQWF